MRFATDISIVIGPTDFAVAIGDDSGCARGGTGAYARTSPESQELSSRHAVYQRCNTWRGSRRVSTRDLVAHAWHGTCSLPDAVNAESTASNTGVPSATSRRLVVARVVGVLAGCYCALVSSTLIVQLILLWRSPNRTAADSLGLALFVPFSWIVVVVLVMSLYQVWSYLWRASSTVPLRLGLVFGFVWLLLAVGDPAPSRAHLLLATLTIPQLATAWFQRARNAAPDRLEAARKPVV